MNHPSQQNSKKRKFNEIANGNREDEDLLFGEAREEGAEAYAGGVDEAMEDNDNLYQEEREAEGSEEGDGEDLIENMEDDY